MEDLVFSIEGPVGFIRLNRPDSFNAIDTIMVKAMAAKIREWELNEAIETILIEGSPRKGRPVFCAGGDVVKMYRSDHSSEEQISFTKHEYELDHLLAICSKPVVSIMDGITMGGGVGISVHCKYKIATENTIWAMPETAIGIFPDVGTSYVLPRLGPVGIYLALTGHRLNGSDCLQLGLASHYTTSSSIPQLKQRLIQHVPIHEALQISEPQALSLAPVMRHIIDIFGKESIQEIFGGLQNLANSLDDTDGAQWAKQTITELLQASPTAVHITFQLMKLGKHSELKECFQAEYCVAHHMVATQHHDFYEGVRAKLIEKTGSPEWSPREYHQVEEANIKLFIDAINDQVVRGHLNFHHKLNDT